MEAAAAMHFSLPLSSSHRCQYSDLLGPGSPTVMRYPPIGTQLPVHGVSEGHGCGWEDGHTRVEAEVDYRRICHDFDLQCTRHALKRVGRRKLYGNSKWKALRA
ncbi:hypothetical protein RIF29_34766 [Crotalaria pallida]|uniref:Uncharacterized protein n=1 Tax=Crotalaria pallida TaxID=3830 RepID=A0AAN9E9N9_CROPI